MNEDVHLKLLIPCVAAGAIIGKGGEAVESIKRQTGARLKMSKANDFYPGTTERVCLIVGTIKACMQLSEYIMQKISERTDPPSPVAHLVSTASGSIQVHIERHNQVKILVPNSTAGVIIGKSGSFIKKIKEKSGAFVQISQRPKELKLMERCIIITGDLDERRIALSMILSKIAEDPDSASCPNCSYTQIQEPVASAFATGSPYALNTTEPHSLVSSAVGMTHIETDPTYGKMDFTTATPIFSPILFGAPIQNSDFCHTPLGYQEISSFIPMDGTHLPNSSILPAVANQLSAVPFGFQSSVAQSEQVQSSKLVAFPHNPWLANTFPLGYYQRPAAVVSPEMLSSQPTTQYSSTLPSIPGAQSADNLSAVAVRMLQAYGISNGCMTTVLENSHSAPVPVFHPSAQTFKGSPYNGCTSSQDFISPPMVDESSMVPVSTHARYWSGGSTDSALTGSFASIRLNSSIDERLPDTNQSPVTRPQSCSFTTSNSAGSAPELHLTVPTSGHSKGVDNTVLGMQTPFSNSYYQTPVLPTAPVVLSPPLCPSSHYGFPFQNTSTFGTTEQFNPGAMVYPFSNEGLSATNEAPLLCVPPTFSTTGYPFNPSQLFYFHPPTVPPSVANYFSLNGVPLSSLPSNKTLGEVPLTCSNTTQTSSGGLLIVGTKQQVRNTLCAMQLNPGLLSVTSSASNQALLTVPTETLSNSPNTHVAASFPPDAPLRLDVIETHHPPATLSPLDSIGQTSTRVADTR